MAGGPNYVISSVPSGVTPATYGSASQAAQVTVDTYGKVTNASQNPLPTLASSTLTIAGGPAYTANLTSGIATPGTYGSASLIPTITVDTYGRITGITTNAPADAGNTYAKAILYNTTTLNNGVTTATVPDFNVSLAEVSTIGAFLTTNGWTFGPTSTASISMASDGRIQYTGATTKTFLVTASLAGIVSSTNGIKIEVRKNGSNAGLTNNFCFSNGSINNEGAISLALNCAISLDTNDYVSMFVGCNVNTGGARNICFGQMELINAG